MAIAERCSTDHHGRLVAPPGFDPAAATAAEFDKAIVELLGFQQDRWLSVVTDGELRRTDSSLADPIAEAEFLIANTGLLVKIRVPRCSDGAIADVEVLARLIEIGVRYIELDASPYSPLIHGVSRQSLADEGMDPDRHLAEMLAADQAVLGVLPVPEDVKISACLHDPMVPTGAAFPEDLDEASARQVFEGLPVTRFMFDCGSEPVDDYSFLSWLPENTEAVLCLVDNNAAEIADAEDVLQELLRASEVIDTDRLALGTRHGFSSDVAADAHDAWDHQSDVFVMHLDAASRAWGIDF